jgi:lysophospholipase L1-like esterase
MTASIGAAAIAAAPEGAGWRLRRWVALGDSFTAGAQPGEPRWADELAADLRRAVPGMDFVNIAAAGARTADVAGAQVSRAIALRPELVTVTCGANDILLSVRPHLAAVGARYGAILARLRAGLPDAVIVTSTYADVTRFYPLRPRSRHRIATGMRQLNELIRTVSATFGAACVELAGHPEEAARENFAADGFHPSSVGHAKAARAFARALQRELGIELRLATEVAR